VRREGFAAHRYHQLTKGHENQLEFDRDYATYDKLQERDFLHRETEEKIRKDLERDMPDHAPASHAADTDVEEDAEGHE
jgi:hypothetical protein